MAGGNRTIGEPPPPTMSIVFGRPTDGSVDRLGVVTDAFCAVWRDPDTGRFHATFSPEEEWAELGLPAAIEAAMDLAMRRETDPLRWSTHDPQDPAVDPS